MLAAAMAWFIASWTVPSVRRNFSSMAFIHSLGVIFQLGMLFWPCLIAESRASSSVIEP
jgi:hypothetical protein